MQEQKSRPVACVIKEGNLYHVYADFNTGVPLPISSISDVPVGGTKQTYPGMGDLRAAMPGFEFKIFEKPMKQGQVIRRSKAVKDEAAALIGNANTKSPQPTPPQEEKPINNKDAYYRAQEFLKRIEFAEQYASEENQVVLATQINIVRQLIEEVFEN